MACTTAGWWSPRSDFRFSRVRSVSGNEPSGPPSETLLWYRLVSIPVRYLRGGRGADGIAGAVERAVADHALSPGDRLPTVRLLADELGVSPTTVAAAYRRLADRGIVTGEGRHGTRVSAGPALPARPAPVVPPGVVNLAAGNPDPRLLPDLRPVLRRLGRPPEAYDTASADEPELVEDLTAELRADGI